jgi:hypothetical protein
LLAAAGLPAVQTPGLRHCPVEDAFGALDLFEAHYHARAGPPKLV